MGARQRVGAVLVVAGVALALVGVAAMLINPATPPVAVASPTPAVSHPAATAAPSTDQPATVVPPTAAPTRDTDAQVRAFFVRLQAAIRAGSQETMVGDLGLAVIDRYGIEACTAFLASRDPVPEQVFELLTIRAPAPWDYLTDEQTTTIPDATTIDARVTGIDAAGAVSTVERELHLQVVDGAVRWFTDCGTPLA